MRDVLPLTRIRAAPLLAPARLAPATASSVGDIIAYAPKSGKRDAGVVHIGRIAGPYDYRPEKSERYPHQRPVVWLKTVPRRELPATAQDALWMKRPTVWRISDGADAFRASVERQGNLFDSVL